MISIKITDIPKFMSLLFSTEGFDGFYVPEASVKTFATFSIDGSTNKAFFEEDDDVCEYARWTTLRPIVREIIKGKKTPVSMHFLFMLPKDKSSDILSNGGYMLNEECIKLLFNIRYGSGEVHVISATNVTTFLPDRSYEEIWDKAFIRFFESTGVGFSIE